MQSQLWHSREEVLALHDLIGREGLLCRHEDEHLDAEGLAGSAWALQVCQVVLDQLLHKTNAHEHWWDWYCNRGHKHWHC